ncbi:MAG TPA: GNAT family N-acetyltransferase [Capillimicrobium sp.]|nr:GNAT family N-acetyltransferase [Capillimicrobium sp.]
MSGTPRLARPDDLERVVAIYNATIPGRMATADLEPVSVEQRRPWFEQRDPTRRPIWVLERGGDVAGWLSVNDFYGRPAYAATAELGVYVAAEHQGSGVGRTLLEHAIAEAPRLAVTTYLAFVFAHNAPSIGLFERFGFARWGDLPGVALLDGRPTDLAILGRRV